MLVLPSGSSDEDFRGDLGDLARPGHKIGFHRRLLVQGGIKILLMAMDAGRRKRIQNRFQVLIRH
jgi:hypothetical protein